LPHAFCHGGRERDHSAMALPVLGGLLIADEVVDIFLPVRFFLGPPCPLAKTPGEKGGASEGAAR